MWRICPYLAILVLGLCLRSNYLFNSKNTLLPGRTETERAAKSLAEEGVLGNVFSPDSGPSAHLAPLYPWVLGQVYRLTNEIGTASRPYQETLATLITCLGITLIPFLAKQAKLYPAAGWIAAFILCLLPGNRFFETSGCHEQPVVFLGLTVLLLLLIQLRERTEHTVFWAVITGIFTGLSGLFAPGFLAIVALFWIVEWITKRDERRRVLLRSLLVGAITFLILLPWAYRNHRELGGWVWTRSNLGLELCVGNNPDATGQTYYPQFGNYHPFGNLTEQAEYKRLGELAYMQHKKEVALTWMKEHPDSFLKLSVARGYWFFFPEESMVWYDGKKWTAYLYGAFSLGMMLGLVVLFKNAHPYRWLFVITILGFALPYLATHIDVRYRYPLNGLCILLTVHVLLGSISWCAKKLKKDL